MNKDRTKTLGASDIAAVLGISPHKTAYQLWEEKTGRREPVQIGEYMEEFAADIEAELRMKLEGQYGLDLCNNHSWVHASYPFIVCHDDGFDDRKQVGAECKYMAHDLVVAKQIPDYYLVQVQYELMLSKGKHWYFTAKSKKKINEQIVYNEFVDTIYPDEKKQAELLQAALNFWNNHVVTDIPPELTDRDTVDLGGDKELAELLTEYEAFDLAAKDFESKKADVKKKIDEKTKEFARAKCTNYLIYRSVRAGNVDYKKVPELKGVDLEQYRSKPIEVLTLRKVKEE